MTRRLSIAQGIMIEFADLTGLSSPTEVPRRYLWTDAFALCNFLELFRQTGDEKYQKLASLLVDQVHGTLGRHREDDRRTGWISGLDEQEGKVHPTIGGLRIGKKINERSTSDPFDDRLEWDRDGQYYHYLTKWMHALNRLSGVTGDPTYNRWAIELAKSAHVRFTYVPFSGGQKRMYWKMSIDLSYPLVPSMGQHDPLDGFITYHELQAGATKDSEGSPDRDLSEEIAEMGGICEGIDWTTNDPLGIGGLLSDAYRIAQMAVRGAFQKTHLLASLLDASRIGLDAFARTNSLKAPVHYRLAFRELGLSIGLHAVERLHQLIERKPTTFEKEQQLRRQIETLMRYAPLVQVIESFWLNPSNREVNNFIEHRDINMVMLATSLAPDEYLAL